MEDYRLYRYTFEDNGIGMIEEFQQHLFEEFSRERDSMSGGVEGTGLGLALCKSFVELMGGSIRCQSKSGVGTTFTVELPFRIQKGTSRFADPETECNVGADAPTPSGCVKLEGMKVLLVEDNELNRELPGRRYGRPRRQTHQGEGPAFQSCAFPYPGVRKLRCPPLFFFTLFGFG